MPNPPTVSSPLPAATASPTPEPPPLDGRIPVWLRGTRRTAYMLRYWRDLAGPDLGEFAFTHMTPRTLGPGGYQVDLPIALVRALPELFPERFKDPGFADYGFLPDRADPDGLPVGLKTGTVSPRRVGITCAACHVGLVRDRPVPGAPNDGLRYGDFLLALREAAGPRLRYEAVVRAALRAGATLSEAELLDLRQYLEGSERLPFGAGRRRGRRFDTPPIARTGSRLPAARWGAGRASYRPEGLPAKIPPLWPGGARYMADGAWTDLGERNRYALFMQGVPYERLRSEESNRLIRALGEYLVAFRPPRARVADRGMAALGKQIFDRSQDYLQDSPDWLKRPSCASCHDRPADLVRAEVVGTDPELLREEPPLERARLLWLGFQGLEVRVWPQLKIPGLAAVGSRRLLLHNGSVRSLEDLLAPAHRPRVVSHAGTAFDTRLPGHSNRGHAFGADLDPGDKDALLVYLRSL